MDVTIRRANLDDAGEIARVQVESWKTTYKGIVPDAAALDMEGQKARALAALVNPEIRLLVAEDQEGIFGFIAGGAVREKLGDFDGELYAIYLLADRQRRGVGSRLCHQLAEDLRALNYRSMLVWVLEQNSAVSFYQRLGGVQVAQKTVDIGGATLPDVAYGWPTWEHLIHKPVLPDGPTTRGAITS